MPLSFELRLSRKIIIVIIIYSIIISEIYQAAQQEPNPGPCDTCPNAYFARRNEEGLNAGAL